MKGMILMLIISATIQAQINNQAGVCIPLKRTVNEQNIAVVNEESAVANRGIITRELVGNLLSNEICNVVLDKTEKKAITFEDFCPSNLNYGEVDESKIKIATRVATIPTTSQRQYMYVQLDDFVLDEDENNIGNEFCLFDSKKNDEDKKTWFEAECRCKELGGSLMLLDRPPLQSAYSQYKDDGATYWIGARAINGRRERGEDEVIVVPQPTKSVHRDNHLGKFVWTLTGDKVGETENWKNNEPNDSSNKNGQFTTMPENCVEDKNGWNDQECAFDRNDYMCIIPIKSKKQVPCDEKCRAALKKSTSKTFKEIQESNYIYCEGDLYEGTSQMYDAWCQSSCNQPTGDYDLFGPTGVSTVCPKSLCRCRNEKESSSNFCSNQKAVESGQPLTWTKNEGTTASNEWCQATCTNNPPNCPCTLCKSDYEEVEDSRYCTMKVARRRYDETVSTFTWEDIKKRLRSAVTYVPSSWAGLAANTYILGLRTYEALGWA